jgi:hypothetical protein
MRSISLSIKEIFSARRAGRDVPEFLQDEPA